MTEVSSNSKGKFLYFTSFFTHLSTILWRVRVEFLLPELINALHRPVAVSICVKLVNQFDLPQIFFHVMVPEGTGQNSTVKDCKKMIQNQYLTIKKLVGHTYHNFM